MSFFSCWNIQRHLIWHSTSLILGHSFTCMELKSALRSSEQGVAQGAISRLQGTYYVPRLRTSSYIIKWFLSTHSFFFLACEISRMWCAAFIWLNVINAQQQMNEGGLSRDQARPAHNPHSLAVPQLLCYVLVFSSIIAFRRCMMMTSRTIRHPWWRWYFISKPFKKTFILHMAILRLKQSTYL